MSKRSFMLADISASRPTDIFLLCHGWKGDVPAAIEQYDLWIAAMENAASGKGAGFLAAK